MSTPNLYDNQKDFYEQSATGYTGFNELVVSNATPLIDLKSIYGVSNIRDKVITTGSGGVTTERGLYKISTGATASSTAALESTEYGRYVAGLEAVAGAGVMLSREPTGNEVGRWGYYDDQNGFGFGIDNQGMFTFIRSGGVERVHREALGEWRYDRNSLDLSILNIYRMPFRWYGAGPVNFEMTYTEADGSARLRVIDSFTAVNGEPITENPNLPIRAEVTNGGDATDFSIYVGGRQFFIQGVYSPNRRITAEHVFDKATSTTFAPLISWKQKDGFKSASVKLEGKELLSSAADLLYEVRVGGTLTGASFLAPSNIPATETAIEFDTAATAITGGQKIFAGLVASGAGNTSGATRISVPEIDVPKGEILTLCARTVSGNGTAAAVLKAREEW